jgi:isopentenyldiphosphate isomerase
MAVPQRKIQAADDWIRIMYPGLTDPKRIENLKKHYFAIVKDVGVRKKKYKKGTIVRRYRYRITPKNFLLLVKGERYYITRRIKKELGIRLTYVQLRYLILMTYEQFYDYPLKKSLKRMGIRKMKLDKFIELGVLNYDGELTETGMYVFNECAMIVAKKSGFELKEASFQTWIFEQN